MYVMLYREGEIKVELVGVVGLPLLAKLLLKHNSLLGHLKCLASMT